MNLYTIGFTKKTAEEFFTLLKKNKIKHIIDIRLNNVSQLAGFSKGQDLKFFLKEINNIEYTHDTELAPNKNILDTYKEKRITWHQYETLFVELLNKRNIKHKLDSYLSKDLNICFLCSEATADKCHRRLVAEFITKSYPGLNIQIVHL